jgi:hypothetical protein
MRRLLNNESGIALVMAVGILAILMVLGSTVIFFAGSNARNAEHSVDTTKALNLADAGENYARAILWNAADPTAATAVGSGSLTLEGGTVTYAGALDTATDTWTLTGTGTYTNPTGGSAAVSRTVSSQVRVTSSGGVDDAWGYLFADNTSYCTNLKNFIDIDAPLYVRGDLCMENQATITSELVQVRGRVDIKDSASIGILGDPVTDVAVAGGCSKPWGGPYVAMCSSSQSVYHSNFSTAPPNITKPTIELDRWYNEAKPGPMSKVCSEGSFPGSFDNDTTLNRSNGTQYLFGSSSYDCKVKDGAGNLLGRIAYYPGNPGTFYIDGVVFFDGKLEFQGNTNVVYQGRGSIYATDEIKIQNYVRFCAVAACDTTWDPEVNLLLLVGGATADSGFLIENYSIYQGAIYVADDYYQKNNVSVCGPVIADELKLENLSANCFVPFENGVPGMPGAEEGDPVITLENVEDSYTTD